jgi:hypothetical protein
MLSILFLSILKFSKEIKTVLLGFSMIVIVNYVGWIYANIRAISVKEAANYVKTHNIQKIVMYHLNTPSFNVYAKMLVEKRKPKTGDYVLTNVKTLQKFSNYKVLFKKGVIVLIHLEKSKETLPFNYIKDRRK